MLMLRDNLLRSLWFVAPSNVIPRDNLLRSLWVVGKLP